jgi:transcriptional regulator with XRE-family HTH domain
METHEQLRQARERRGLSLNALHDRTGVREPVLAALERGAWEELPAGLYGRHAVRAYARTVGLDADSILESVARMLPEPEDPLDGLARVRGFARRVRPVEPARDSGHQPEPPPDCVVDDSFSIDWRPVLAAAIDGAVLLGFAVALMALTVAAAGTSLATVAPVAAPAWTFLTGLVSASYFVLLGGVRSQTPGALLAGMTRRCGERGQIDARTAVTRGLSCALRESSIVLDLLARSGNGQVLLRAITQRS